MRLVLYVWFTVTIELYSVRPSRIPGIACPNLTNPENGLVIQALLDGNVPGTVANYSCNADYALFGNVSRECVSTGLEVVWAGEAPTCQRRPL